MFNFLASQHRQLPDTDLYDEEEDEVLLKSTRSNNYSDFPRTTLTKLVNWYQHKDHSFFNSFENALRNERKDIKKRKRPKLLSIICNLI